MIDKQVVQRTIEWLECYLDECCAAEEEKAEVQSVINFWRLYVAF